MNSSCINCEEILEDVYIHICVAMVIETIVTHHSISNLQ